MDAAEIMLRDWTSKPQEMMTNDARTAGEAWKQPAGNRRSLCPATADLAPNSLNQKDGHFEGAPVAVSKSIPFSRKIALGVGLSSADLL